jgi:pimeloyl-ACP methyl ester carboxylesterase
VLPARSAGYREIWIAGISMGGLGALSYAVKYPGHLDRVLLLAPYLGEAHASDPHFRELWRWIVHDEGAPERFSRLCLGYGTARCVRRPERPARRPAPGRECARGPRRP